MPNRKRKRKDVVSLTIRNVPDDLYELLKQSAKRNRRSMSSEAIFILEKTSRLPVDPAEFLERARRLRESTAGRGKRKTASGG
jgi:plasmid stability protein